MHVANVCIVSNDCFKCCEAEVGCLRILSISFDGFLHPLRGWNFKFNCSKVEEKKGKYMIKVGWDSIFDIYVMAFHFRQETKYNYDILKL